MTKQGDVLNEENDEKEGYCDIVVITKKFVYGLQVGSRYGEK